MDTGPTQVHALDIKVSDDGSMIGLSFKTGEHRITVPMPPDRLAGLIDVLQRAAALAAERRRATAAKATLS